MSLPILLTQFKIAGIRTLASSAHETPPSVVGAQHAAPDLAKTAATHLDNPSSPLSPWEVDWCQPVALLVGNEGAGLPEEVERSADARIRISMASGVESLNAAAAAAVVFYEAARQRNAAVTPL
jgi:tRNA G18 (ribose-2'-O)-methylase SpoU